MNRYLKYIKKDEKEYLPNELINELYDLKNDIETLEIILKNEKIIKKNLAFSFNKIKNKLIKINKSENQKEKEKILLYETSNEFIINQINKYDEKIKILEKNKKINLKKKDKINKKFLNLCTYLNEDKCEYKKKYHFKKKMIFHDYMYNLEQYFKSLL